MCMCSHVLFNFCCSWPVRNISWLLKAESDSKAWMTTLSWNLWSSDRKWKAFYFLGKTTEAGGSSWRLNFCSIMMEDWRFLYNITLRKIIFNCTIHNYFLQRYVNYLLFCWKKLDFLLLRLLARCIVFQMYELIKLASEKHYRRLGFAWYQWRSEKQSLFITFKMHLLWPLVILRQLNEFGFSFCVIDSLMQTGCGRLRGQIALNSVIIVEKAESEPLGNRQYPFQVTM